MIHFNAISKGPVSQTRLE